uniref:hypothetical protein n=1 Tax=Aliarcobacter sp. TaxID=2321116 RepID=UPI004048662E
MSFYLGKDNNGISVMHLTKDIHSKVDMKSGVLPDTVFHSSLRYLTFNKYVCKLVNNTTFELSNELIDRINNDNLCFFFVINGNLISSIRTAFGVDAGNPEYLIFHSTISNIYDISVNPTYSYKYIITSGYNISSVSLIMLNLDENGSFITNPNYDESKGIFISRTDLSINNINLLDFKYVSIGTINNIDDAISVAGTTKQLQLINSNIQDGAGGLILDSTEKIIYKNNNPIFSYLNGDNKYMYDSASSFVLARYSIQVNGGHTPSSATHNTGLKFPMDRFTLFIFQRSINSTPSTPITTTYFIYPGGAMANIYSAGVAKYDFYLTLDGSLFVKLSSGGDFWGWTFTTESYTVKSVTFK